MFEIIGEAMSQALIDEPELGSAVPEARQVIGMRNRIIHGYDVVWDSVTNDVPALLDRVNALLDERGWG